MKTGGILLLEHTWMVWLLALVTMTKGVSAQTSSNTCDACAFDGTDQEDCKVYGKIDDQLIAWNKGSEECKEIYDIAINSGVDPNIICASASSFVNDLRFGFLQSSTAKLGLGMSEGGFFEQGDGNAIVLLDSVTINGAVFDCSVSKSDCYNAMKPYFESDSQGQQEMMQVCETLYSQAKTDRELEESTLRIRLCQEVRDDPTLETSAAAVCDPLLAQLVEQLEAFPSKDCSGFGFGPGSTDICYSSESNQGDGGTDSSATESFYSGDLLPGAVLSLLAAALLLRF